MTRPLITFVILAALFTGPRSALTDGPPRAAKNESEIASLTAQLTDENDDVRRQAAYSLGRLGTKAQPATDALLPLLKDRYREVRWYTAEALGRIGPSARQAVSPLAAALDDPESDRFMRRASAEALGRIGSVAKPASEKLALLLDDEDHGLRVAAAVALWKIERHDRSESVLIETIKTGTGDGPYEAIRAVARLNIAHTDRSAALVAALGHTQSDVRHAAAKALGSIGGNAISAIAKQTANSNPKVQLAALSALGFLADDLRVNVFYQDRTTRKQFSAAAGKFKTAIKAMVTRLGDPSAEVRRRAAISLAKLGPLVLRDLLSTLQMDDVQSQAGAIDALIVLEQFLPKAEQPALIQLLNKRFLPTIVIAMKNTNSDVRGAAVRLLVALRIDSLSTDAKRQLQQMLKDENVATRRYAATLLQ